MTQLSGKQRRYLRGLGHHLTAIVRVGQRGVWEAVEEKVQIELDNHELIKLKVGSDCTASAKEVGETLATSAGAALVQVLGRTVLLYRRRKEEPEIVLPN
jgi:RNA-binding protein